MIPLPVPLPILAGSLCLLLCAVLIALRRPRRNLPPGPKGLPIIGNLFDLPPRGGRNWEHYVKQKELYGPVTSLSALGTTIVLLHDFELAREFLDKRAVIASNRPRPFFLTEMCGGDKLVGLLPYDRPLRAMRKHIHAHIGTQKTLAEYADIQDIETRRFLLRILYDPTRFLHHIKSEAAGIMLQTIYGYTINVEGTDPIIEIVERASADVAIAAQPGVWSVDAIPALHHLPDWFPGTYFKRVAREIDSTAREFAGRPWEFTKQQMAKGTHESSFVLRLHERAGGNLSDEDAYIAKLTANGLYSGGADTTVSSIMTFFLIMMHHPEIQRKGQDELDRIIGQDRLPGLEDRGNLPYTEALITEVLRFHTVAPEGLPHVTTEDCEFEGYFIPKGTSVTANLWWFAHDPEVYHDPGTFKPDRFLGDNPERDPRTFIFGFGRRICPGRLLANSNLFLTLVRSLATLDIRKPVDAQGNEYAPRMVFEHGFVSHPEHFDARVTFRNEKYKEMIREVERTHPMGKGSAEDLAAVKEW